MTFSELELHWIEYCVQDLQHRYSGTVDFAPLLHRIEEERTKLQQTRVPRTVSETPEYKDKYYQDNKEKILARMKKKRDENVRK